MPVKKQAISKVKTPALPIFETPKNLKLYLQEFAANLPDDEEMLWAGAMQCVTAEILGFIHAGQYFIKLRDGCEHGHFRAALADRGFGLRYAYERIQIAEKFTQVETTDFDKANGLGVSKLRKIAAWNVEDIVEFFGGNEVYGITIDQAHEMSRRDFEAQIKANRDETKALQKALLNKEEDLIDLEKENEVLKRQINGESLANDWPDVVVKARHESCAILEQSNLGINVLEKLLNELIEQQKHLKPLEYDVGFSSIFHNLNAIMARGQDLINAINENYQGTQALNQDANIVPLSQAEIQVARQRSTTLNQFFIREQMEREEKRQKNKAPRRGRPTKVTRESMA